MTSRASVAWLAFPLLLGGVLFAALPTLSRRDVPRADAERYLLAAAREGDAAAIEGLVGAGISVETRDARGFTALILAAYHGHAEAVRTLLPTPVPATVAATRPSWVRRSRDRSAWSSCFSRSHAPSTRPTESARPL